MRNYLILGLILICTLAISTSTGAAPMDYEEHTEAHALSHGAEVMSNSLGTDNSTNILFASNLDGAFYSKILVFIIIAIYALASFARWLGREKANE